jgi:hypothetical protein
LRIETVFILTVYEVLHDLLLFSLARCIIRGRGYDDSLRHFSLCPGNFNILMINLELGVFGIRGLLGEHCGLC